MAIPAFGAVGAAAAGTTTMAPALPAGVATGDLMLLCMEYGNAGAPSITNQAGGNWQAAGNSPAEALSGTAAGSAIFYDYYNGSQTAPTVTVSNHCCGRIMSITGARSADGANFGGAAADMGDVDLNTTCTFVTGLSTTDADCLIVLVAGGNDDSPTFGATWTNANLANINVRVSDTTMNGNDGSCDVVTGELATAGAVGTFTNTFTAANAYASGVCIAIRPPAAGGGGSLLVPKSSIRSYHNVPWDRWA